MAHQDAASTRLEPALRWASVPLPMSPVFEEMENIFSRLPQPTIVHLAHPTIVQRPTPTDASVTRAVSSCCRHPRPRACGVADEHCFRFGPWLAPALGYPNDQRDRPVTPLLARGERCSKPDRDPQEPLVRPRPHAAEWHEDKHHGEDFGMDRLRFVYEVIRPFAFLFV